MKFSNIVTSVTAQFKQPNGFKIIPYLEGAPGGGKSACAKKIGEELGFTPENVHQFFASLRDPVDLMGTPMPRDGITHWNPPVEIARLQTGRHLFIIEEISDATTPMQNALCGFMYDRRINDVKLSDEVYFLATGNRTKDKSGAQRIQSKLAGRMRRYEYTENIDDWSEWALDSGLDVLLIQFLRFKPSLLSDFNPDNFSSPTPRTWEKVAMCPTDLSPELYLETITGDVGPGAAAEYVAFRRVAEKMPSIDLALMQPDKVEIPTDLATLYAFTGALAHRATRDNFERIEIITERLAPEFSVMLVNDAVRMTPDIRKAKAYTTWAIKNAKVLV